MAIRNHLCWILCIALWYAAFPFTGSAASAAPAVKAEAALLMSTVTGQVLYEKKAHARNAPASTTKIITAIIALESGHLDDEVRVSRHAASTPGSSMHLYAGQLLSLRELITGLLLRSGNDAAVAIAEHLAGSVEEFARLMNQKALLLGARNSHFRNPHGLSTPEHYTTAYDLAVITRYALNNPLFAEIVSTKETAIEWLDRGGRERDVNLRNTNKLLWMFEDADGVKTGTTGEAGPCLVSSATRDGHQLIAVVLNDRARWYDSLLLLKYGFESFTLVQHAPANSILAVIPVLNGIVSEVYAVTAAEAALVVPESEQANLTIEVDLPETMNAPIFKGQKIGEVIFFLQDKAVKTVDIISADTIEENTLTRRFFQQLMDVFRHLASFGLI